MAWPLPRKLGPPTGSEGWDAYGPRAQLFTSFIPGTDANTVYVKYGHRRPTAWQLNGQDFQQYGPGIDTQAVADAEIVALADGGVDWCQFDWYPANAAIAPPQADIMKVFEAYRTSAFKARMKWGFMIDPNWLSYGPTLPLPGDWSNLTAFLNYIATAIADAQYMRVNGFPIIGVYNYASLSAGNKTTFQNALTTLAGLVGSPLYILVQDHSSTTRADLLAMSPTVVGSLSLCTYGPNPGLTSTPGQYPWSQQATSDSTLWTSSGGGQRIACSVTPVQDRRPLTTAGVTAYIDQPSMPALSLHLSNAFNFFQSGVGTPDLVMYHAKSENTEGGPGILPTIQERKRYLDALLWQRTGVRPSSYLYELDAAQLDFTKTGSWTKSAQTFGLFNGDELVSSALNDSITFSHDCCLGLGWLWTIGPDRGIAEVSINGSVVGLFDQYSPVTQYQVLGFMSAQLSGGTQTIKIRDTNSKNPSSSSPRIGCDACRIIYRP